MVENPIKVDQFEAALKDVETALNKHGLTIMQGSLPAEVDDDIYIKLYISTNDDDLEWQSENS